MLKSSLVPYKKKGEKNEKRNEKSGKPYAAVGRFDF
jgi:hypothetical protein